MQNLEHLDFCVQRSALPLFVGTQVMLEFESSKPATTAIVELDGDMSVKTTKQPLLWIILVLWQSKGTEGGRWTKRERQRFHRGCGELGNEVEVLLVSLRQEVCIDSQPRDSDSVW